jgi:hypothetical protein
LCALAQSEPDPARWERLAFLAVAWFTAVAAAELLAFATLALRLSFRWSAGL